MWKDHPDCTYLNLRNNIAWLGRNYHLLLPPSLNQSSCTGGYTKLSKDCQRRNQQYRLQHYSIYTFILLGNLPGDGLVVSSLGDDMVCLLSAIYVFLVLTWSFGSHRAGTCDYDRKTTSALLLSWNVSSDVLSTLCNPPQS